MELLELSKESKLSSIKLWRRKKILSFSQIVWIKIQIHQITNLLDHHHW